MRVLILGGFSMIGHQIYRQLHREFPQLKVCIQESAAEALKTGFFNPNQVIDRIDFLHEKGLEVALRNSNPDVIINCTGLTAKESEILATSEMLKIQSVFPNFLHDWCQQHSAFLIHFSSDEVFEGRDIPYEESSLPDAKTLFGRAMALGEVQGPHCLTLRASLLGPDLGSTRGYFSKLSQNPQQTVLVSRSHFYCGVTTQYLAQFVADHLRFGLPVSGLYQIASQPISEFDLIHGINRHFHWNLKIQEIPGNPSPQKILSNQKILRAWPKLTPRWNDMLYDLQKSLEPQAVSVDSKSA